MMKQRRALAAIVEQGPLPAIHGVVRWRRKDLARWICEEYGISQEESSVGRELVLLVLPNSRLALVIEGRTGLRWTSFKKLPSRVGGSPQKAPERTPDRSVLAGRGAYRAENQDHTSLGKARNSACCPERSKDKISLYLRGYLSGPWRRCRFGSALLQQASHAVASGRNLLPSRRWYACDRHSGSGWLAHNAKSLSA